MVRPHRRSSANVFMSDNANEEKDIYFFGIFSGKDMCYMGNHINENGVKYNNIYGFDSFKGLPQENYLDNKNMGVPDEWKEGSYNSLDIFESGSDIPNIVKTKFKEETTLDIDIITGFFEDTLTDNLIDEYKMKPASYVDIDTDLYISCYQILDWMASHNLIENTIIYFDDWMWPKKEYTGGESLAFKQICEKYNYESELLNVNWSSNNQSYRIFMVNQTKNEETE